MMPLTYAEFSFHPQVRSFVEWLWAHLDIDPAGPVLHEWIARSNRAATNRGDRWFCVSLYDAYAKYYWMANDPVHGTVITNFSQSARCLSALSQRLDTGIGRRDAQLCLNTCLNILRWGGVNQWRVASVIRRLGPALPAYLAEVRRWLNTVNGPMLPVLFHFEDGGTVWPLEVDSGTTKIYSLLNQDWIIYDGRVGAAIGFLAARWAGDNNCPVPPILRFAWGYENRRNPNNLGDNTFPMFGQNVNRLQHNLYANWLCKLVTNNGRGTRFDDIPEQGRLRALEAALFMIGYCVRNCRAAVDEEASSEISTLRPLTCPDVTYPEQVIRKFAGRTTCFIPGQRGAGFQAELTEEGVRVDCLGSASLLSWQAFAEAECLLRESGGCAPRGNAMGHRLGDSGLTLDSVEGRIASQVYGRAMGETVFRRISPIANILVWAGVCIHRRGYLCSSALLE